MKYFLRCSRRIFDRLRALEHHARALHTGNDRDQNPRGASMDHDDASIETSLVFS